MAWSDRRQKWWFTMPIGQKPKYKHKDKVGQRQEEPSFAGKWMEEMKILVIVSERIQFSRTHDGGNLLVDHRLEKIQLGNVRSVGRIAAGVTGRRRRLRRRCRIRTRVRIDVSQCRVIVVIVLEVLDAVVVNQFVSDDVHATVEQSMKSF